MAPPFPLLMPGFMFETSLPKVLGRVATAFIILLLMSKNVVPYLEKMISGRRKLSPNMPVNLESLLSDCHKSWSVDRSMLIRRSQISLKCRVLFREALQFGLAKTHSGNVFTSSIWSLIRRQDRHTACRAFVKRSLRRALPFV